MFNIEKYNEIKDFLKKSSDSCEIIAVSKNHSKEKVITAINAGVHIFGENRVIEAKEKFTSLKTNHPNITLHLTGPLQSNKVKQALELFDVFHTLDREKIVKEFSKNIDKITNKELYVQVNTGKEETKSGLYPEVIDEFLMYCKNDLHLNISGLMCIPPIDQSPEIHFNLLKNIASRNNLKNLSIGMSNDYKIALKFNPKYIRLGTILFGNR